MQKLIAPVFILLCFFSEQATAQYSWFIDFKGTGYSGAESMSIGPDGIISVIGNFENGIKMGSTTYSGKGSFFARITREGILISHEIIRYSTSDTWWVSHVGTDGEGNSYISGTFPNRVTLFGVTLTSEDSYNGFIVKIKPDGTLAWTKTLKNVQEFFDMKVNQSGDIVLLSHHYGTVEIDHVTIAVGANSFGMLLSTTGNLKWVKTLGDPSRFNTWGRACALDNSGQAYFYGVYNGKLSLDGKQITSTGGYYDYFFTRINPDGICEWIKSAERKVPEWEPTTLPNGSGSIIERGALQTDNEGNVYAAGGFQHGMKIGTVTLSGSHLFLLKFNETGALQWTKAPEASDGNNTVDDIIIRNNWVYFSGTISGRFYFSIYKPDGTSHAEMTLLPIKGDIASGMDVDAQDNLYMSGRQNKNPDLNAFIFKYGLSTIPKTLPGDAGTIPSIHSFCFDQHSVLVSTLSIQHAVSYEWELKYNTELVEVTSDGPQLEVLIESLGITEEFSVRVRGVNESGKGKYSPWRLVTAVKPLENPVLRTSCNALETSVKESQELKWYRDTELLPQYSQPRIEPEESGMYYVTISNGCELATSNTIPFEALQFSDIVTPNIITPNGDGLNDFFEIDEKFAPASLAVYNRFGKKVYSSGAYANEWNGHNVSAGIYYYEINNACLEQPVKGYLTIVP